MTPKVKEIANIVCYEFNIALSQLTDKCRKHELITPRHTAIYLVHKKYKGQVSQNFIAKMFNRDRTTLIHAIQNVEGWIDVYPEFAEQIKRIEAQIAHINLVPKKTLTIEEKINLLPKEKQQLIYELLNNA